MRLSFVRMFAVVSLLSVAAIAATVCLATGSLLTRHVISHEVGIVDQLGGAQVVDDPLPVDSERA